MKQQGNMALQMVHNSSITESRDMEMDEMT